MGEKMLPTLPEQLDNEPNASGTWCEHCRGAVSSTVFATKRRSFFTLRGRRCDRCGHIIRTAEFVVSRDELDFFAELARELAGLQDAAVVAKCVVMLQANTAGPHIRALVDLGKREPTVASMLKRLEFGRRL